MKKFFFCLTAALFAAGTAQAEYVRKTVRPSFFIPAKELNRVEKLPPFPERPLPAAEPDDEEDIHYVIPAKTVSTTNTTAHVVVDSETPPEKVHVNFRQLKLMDDKTADEPEEIAPSENRGQIDKSLEQTESYINIRKAYAEDLKTIAETGNAPENQDVTTALQKMTSDDHIWVDDNFPAVSENDIIPE